MKKMWTLGLLAVTAIVSAAEIRPISGGKAPFEAAKGTKRKFIETKAVFQDDKIVFGNKTLSFAPDGSLQYYADGRPMMDMSMLFFTPKVKRNRWVRINAKNLPRKFTRDAKKQTCEWTASFPVQDGCKDMADVRQRLELVGSKVRLSWSYQAPEEMAGFKPDFLSLTLSPANVRAGTKVQVNYAKKNATVEFKEKLNFAAGRTTKFTLFDEAPEKALTVSMNPAYTLILVHHPKDNRWYGRIMWNPGKNVRQATLTLELDFGKTAAVEKSSDTYAGIDFWKNDRLHLSDFGKRNLFRNSSFESGMRYFCFHKNIIQNSSFESGLRYFCFHGTASQYVPEKDFPLNFSSKVCFFQKKMQFVLDFFRNIDILYINTIYLHRKDKKSWRIS